MNFTKQLVVWFWYRFTKLMLKIYWLWKFHSLPFPDRLLSPIRLYRWGRSSFLWRLRSSRLLSNFRDRWWSRGGAGTLMTPAFFPVVVIGRVISSSTTVMGWRLFLPFTSGHLLQNYNMSSGLVMTTMGRTQRFKVLNYTETKTTARTD